MIRPVVPLIFAGVFGLVSGASEGPTAAELQEQVRRGATRPRGGPAPRREP